MHMSKHLQEGWEAFNSAFKTYYFSRTQRGNRKHDLSDDEIWEFQKEADFFFNEGQCARLLHRVEYMCRTSWRSLWMCSALGLPYVFMAVTVRNRVCLEMVWKNGMP